MRGLLLQGGTLEGGKITDQLENKVELQPLPNCHLAWLPKEEARIYPANATAEVPVYFTLARESLLCQLTLPQVGDPDDKVISGIAIFIQGSE